MGGEGEGEFFDGGAGVGGLEEFLDELAFGGAAGEFGKKRGALEIPEVGLGGLGGGGAHAADVAGAVAKDPGGVELGEDEVHFGEAGLEALSLQAGPEGEEAAEDHAGGADVGVGGKAGHQPVAFEGEEGDGGQEQARRADKNQGAKAEDGQDRGEGLFLKEVGYGAIAAVN
jgi:hypothetical protein